LPAYYFDSPFILRWLLHLHLNKIDVSDIFITIDNLVLMGPISEAIVCDSSRRFSERTSIRAMTRIKKTIIANGLPTTGRKQKFGIFL